MPELADRKRPGVPESAARPLCGQRPYRATRALLQRSSAAVAADSRPRADERPPRPAFRACIAFLV